MILESFQIITQHMKHCPFQKKQILILGANSLSDYVTYLCTVICPVYIHRCRHVHVSKFSVYIGRAEYHLRSMGQIQRRDFTLTEKASNIRMWPHKKSSNKKKRCKYLYTMSTMVLLQIRKVHHTSLYKWRMDQNMCLKLTETYSKKVCFRVFNFQSN